MTHKIYWAERGLRYLYEVVTAELFMYTFCMIFMRQDPRFTDAIWIAGIFLLSYLIRDFAPNHILLTQWYRRLEYIHKKDGKKLLTSYI